MIMKGGKNDRCIPASLRPELFVAENKMQLHLIKQVSSFMLNYITKSSLSNCVSNAIVSKCGR